MSNQFASITISGRIGSAELKEIGEGLVVTRVSVAVNTYFRGEEITTWYTCQLWNGNGDDLSRRCNDDLASLKGALVTLSGKFVARPYTSNSGQAKTELLLENPVILGLGLKKVEENVTEALPKEAPKKANKTDKAAE
jgi:single-stranded DNA-binding protein